MTVFNGAGKIKTPPVVVRSVFYLDQALGDLRSADLVINNGYITDICQPGAAALAPMSICGAKQICVPGLVNAHLHPSKELYHGIHQAENASAMLDAVHLNNATETADQQANATLYCLATGLLNGITSVGIFTSRPFVDAIQASKLGVRAQVFFSQNDRWEGGGARPDTNTRANIINRLDKARDELETDTISVNPATASEFAATDALLLELHRKAARQNRRFSMHISEGPERVAAFIDKFQETPIGRLARLKLLDEYSTLIHSAVLTEHDIRLLKESRVSLVHCPASNAFTTAGICPAHHFVGSHNVGFGTDSAMINPVNSLAFEGALALYLHGSQAMTEKLSVSKILDCLTRSGAQAIGLEDCGSIQVGMKADLIFYSLGNYCLEHNIPVQLLNRFLTDKPKTVMVDGKIVVHNHALVTGDYRSIANNFFEDRKVIWDRRTRPQPNSIKDVHFQADQGDKL